VPIATIRVSTKEKMRFAGCNLSHELIERILGSVGIAPLGPEVAAIYLLAECLVLIYPPIAHMLSLRRFSMHLYVISCRAQRNLRAGLRTGLPSVSDGVSQSRRI
jgi:hypothetical protein